MRHHGVDDLPQGNGSRIRAGGDIGVDKLGELGIVENFRPFLGRLVKAGEEVGSFRVRPRRMVQDVLHREEHDVRGLLAKSVEGIFDPQPVIE